MSTIYHFKIEGIDGEEIDLADYKGKKILIVNVASACGFTPQYRQLQELYTEFSKHLVVIAFPSNDFGGQEPGTNAEIKYFCEGTYQVSFPLATKINISTEPIHPLFKWLSNKAENGVMDTKVTWNFCKYLINEQGHLIAFFPSAVSPIDESILERINS